MLYEIVILRRLDVPSLNYLHILWVVSIFTLWVDYSFDQQQLLVVKLGSSLGSPLRWGNMTPSVETNGLAVPLNICTTAC